jgi:hypothetical protein
VSARRLVVALLVAALSVTAAPVATAATSAHGTTATAAAKHKHKRNRRRGGHVRTAWPYNKHKHAPHNLLARWLAKQVGPVKRHKHRKRTSAAVASASDTGTSAGLSTSGTGTLLLVRSFDIPTSDSAYGRLANYSWTYDNALATFAFISVGAKSAAEEILDQLKALQRADGSIEFAFDTRTGASAPYFRTGALAWVGLAAAAYRRKYDSDRYDAMIGGLLKYLLALRTSDGLVRGGPDVSWVSTQHNLLTVGLLRDLEDQLGKKETIGGYSKSDLETIQAKMGDAVLSKFLVRESATAYYFKQGIDDGQIPLDVQALGAIYLKLRGDARAPYVANAITTKFAVAPRRMADGSGPFSGYRPFNATGSPDVIWSEGTIEASLAFSRLGIANAAADSAVASLASTVSGSTSGPIGSDRDVVSQVWGEYHTWPTSAAASWLLIRVAPQQLLLTE